MKGRLIIEKALAAIANYKHALQLYNKWIGPNGNLPSGRSFNDGCIYVRKKMFMKLRGDKANAKPVQDGKPKKVVT
jgi:hypothetical protein